MRALQTNPYTNRGAIRKPEDFFGRTGMIEDVYKRLLGGQSVSLVGERRIGKSSLLNALRFQREEYDFPSEFRFVFLDLQSIAGCTEDFFLEFLTSLIAEETEQLPKGSGRSALIDMVQELSTRNQRLVVLLDELEVLMHNDKISPQLFSFLRAWSGEYGVFMVVAFREGSVDRIVESPGLGSPFLNVFGSVYVGPLEETEARELVVSPAAVRGISFSEEETRRILELCGYFPLFLQIACYHMFELCQSGSIRSDWQEELQDRFTLEATPYFEYIWGQLSNRERKSVQELSASGKVPESRSDVWKALLRKGIAISEGQRTRLFSSAFELFVTQRAGTDSVQEGFTQSVKKSLFG